MSRYESLSETQQFACRVIADHARSTAFSIADGILPGNEGRNYVLRKIMRRAIYHGREHLGLTDLFFYKVCDFVIDRMHAAFPELEAQREFIGKMVRLEEERFGNTLTVGLKKLDELFERTSFEQRALITLLGGYKQVDFSALKEMVDAEVTEEAKAESKAVAFAAAALQTFTENEEMRNEAIAQAEAAATPFFKEIAQLYDTYGTPRDLIRVYLEEKGIVFEEDDFNQRFDVALHVAQRQSGVGQTERKSQISPIYAELSEKIGSSKFHGYDATRIDEANVVAIVKYEKQVDELREGDEGLVILNDTPFYAEAGGQVGDTGFLTGQSLIAGDQKETDHQTPAAEHFFRARVLDTFAPLSGLILHKAKVESGSIKVGNKVSATVDVEKRDATRRNHTATHLVHAALREVLGTHVKQAGSVVAPNYLRFDFTHYKPMTEIEVAEIEDLVNRYILENQPVNTNIMAIEEAMHGGAMALFGEKYGADVRVLSVGDGVFSKELCGGTHVKATGDIGAFKITSDEAIASGVRRIRAITGFDAFERFREDERLIDRSLAALKTQRDNLPSAIERLQDEVKRTRKEIDELKLKIATGAIGGASSNGDEARDVNGVKVLGKVVEGLDGNGARQLSDTLLARLKSGVIVLGRETDGKVSIIVRVSDDLTGKVKAGNVIKEIVPIVGGKGGGRADMAEGGGTEPTKLSEAIDASYGVIEKMLA
jgi:alanyl-tRNA synthetase